MSKKTSKDEGFKPTNVSVDDKGTLYCTVGGKDWISFDGKTWVEKAPRIEIEIPKTAKESLSRVLSMKHDDSIIPQISALKYMKHAMEQHNNFIKKDSGKLKWSLLPFEQLRDVVKVLMLGAEKYSPDNWKKCDDVTRYKDALMRHVVSYVTGDKTDKESGLSHLAHAICNCLFLMWFDDRKEEHENDVSE